MLFSQANEDCKGLGLALMFEHHHTSIEASIANCSESTAQYGSDEALSQLTIALNFFSKYRHVRGHPEFAFPILSSSNGIELKFVLE